MPKRLNSTDLDGLSVPGFSNLLFLFYFGCKRNIDFTPCTKS